MAMPSTMLSVFRRGRGGLGLCLVAWALVCGCISVFVQETYEKADEPGEFVSPVDLALVRPGETTRDELVERLGPPSETTEIGPGHELLTYTYWVRRAEERTVAPFKRSMQITHSVLSLKCDVQDGVVTGVEREVEAPSEAEPQPE